jgi:hypothetical protein
MDLITRMLIMGAAGSTKPPDYWLLEISVVYPAQPNSGPGGGGGGGGVDSNGNVYISGSEATSNGCVIKITKNGGIAWAKKQAIGSTISAQTSAVSVGGNVHSASYQNSAGGMYHTEFDVDGNLSGSTLYDGGSNSEYINQVKFLKGSNQLRAITGWTENYDGTSRALMSIPSSIFSIGFYVVISSTNPLAGVSVATTASANTYFSFDNGSSSFVGIFKTSNGASIDWARQITSGSGSIVDSVTDASGNVCVLRGASGTSSVGMQLLKIANDGNSIAWQRRLTSANLITPSGLAIDSSDNLYAIGNIDSGIVIAKYNSSGTLQWQRRLSSGSNSITGRGVYVNGNDLYVICRISGGSYTAMVAKLKVDGSMTGTYGSYVYAASSYTDSANSSSLSSITLTTASWTPSGGSVSSTTTNHTTSSLLTTIL